MRQAIVNVIAASGILFASGCAPRATQPEPADLVVRNATIYTVDATRSWAQALAVSAGRLVYVGTNLGAQAFVGPRTSTVDIGGWFLLPGLHDSHVHPVESGVLLGQCDLSKAQSVEEVLSQIKAYAEANHDKPWVLGRGWTQTFFPDANPHKSLLDSVVPDRPALFWEPGGHDIWVNSRALEISGITRETPDTERGLIERDPKTGEPTGTLRESAVNLVLRHVPETTDQERIEGLRHALKNLNRFGIISIQDAKVTTEFLETYTATEREGKLTARVRTALNFDPTRDDEEQIRQFLEWRRAHPGPRLNAGTVKLFIDGVFFNRTAALLEPYIGLSGNASNDYGMLNFDIERLDRLVTRLDSEGFQVHMHAIGGRAIRIALDAVEQARRANGVRDSRHHIAHLHMIHPSDLPRFRQLGVIATFQPFWAWPIDYNVKLIASLVGPERFRRLHSIRSLMDSGAIVAAGSDWPVTTPNPLDAIQVGMTRRTLEAQDGPALHYEQRVDLPRLIAAYTIAGAYVNFEDQNSGSIEVGKWADFIVLDRNLFEIPVHEIYKAKVLWTVLEGQEVYRAEDWK